MRDLQLLVATTGLNFGDCFSYAEARLGNIPLLYTGNDFSQTDVATVFRRR